MQHVHSSSLIIEPCVTLPLITCKFVFIQYDYSQFLNVSVYMYVC